MFRAHAWTGGFRALALAVVAATLLTPGISADSTEESEVDRTLAMMETWAEDRYDWAMQTAGGEPQLQGDDEDPEESSNERTVQAWVAREADKAEGLVTTTASDAFWLVVSLQDEAHDQVAQGQHLLATIVAEPEEEEPEVQSAQAVESDNSALRAAAVIATVAAAATAGSLAIMFWTAGSTVGTAGGASASAKSGASGLKKVAPVLSPLFTRFEGREVLKHPNRAQLYTLIAANPGVRLQDLCVETELSRTAVTHHVRLLEQQHLIVSERVGRSRHYYENGGRYEREKKDAYAVLQNDRSRDIARFILGNPGAIQKQVCESLDLRASIAHWHIKRLQEASLVDCVRKGRTVSYYPAGNLSSIAV